MPVSEELGYPEGAVQKKVVNLVEGANFIPDFLKIVGRTSFPSHRV